MWMSYFSRSTEQRNHINITVCGWEPLVATPRVTWKQILFGLWQQTDCVLVLLTETMSPLDFLKRGGTWTQKDSRAPAITSLFASQSKYIYDIWISIRKHRFVARLRG